MTRPKIRDGKAFNFDEPYDLNNIPDEIILKIAGSLIYNMHIGNKDLDGNTWADAFANAIDGINLSAPIGIADVTWKTMAWSLKTVKAKNPFDVKQVRLISGRCSPDYSYGISDPHEDLNRTGRAVLNIWNERVNLAQEQYNPVRTIVLIRSYDLLSYCLYEEENHRFRTSDYEWSENKNGNLIGTEILTGKQCFTWQPHGSQFTIHEVVPPGSIKFTIKAPPILNKKDFLEDIQFDNSWVSIIRQ